MLRAAYGDGATLTQTKIAAALGCSQAMASEYLGGRSRPGPRGRALARIAFNIPDDAWFMEGEVPPDPSAAPIGAPDDASSCEEPQAARASSEPPFSGAPEART